MPRERPVIAIDGPAGAGKSTAARGLAERLGFTYVNTGNLFRGIAYVAMQHNIPLEEGAAVARIAESVRLSFVYDGSDRPSRLHVNDVDRSLEIRMPEVTRVVPIVAAHPEVRRALLGLQRKLGENGGVVLEGRDIGTEVFPDAEVKVYLTASLERRAIRQHGDLVSRGIPSEIGKVFDDIRERDRMDESRAVAPLRRAMDAELLDTSKLTQDEVLDQLMRIVRARAHRTSFPHPL